MQEAERQVELMEVEAAAASEREAAERELAPVENELLDTQHQCVRACVRACVSPACRETRPPPSHDDLACDTKEMPLASRPLRVTHAEQHGLMLDESFGKLYHETEDRLKALR
jgi:hypothetical protein